MTDLVAFLRARLDEDEGIALHARPVASLKNCVAYYYPPGGRQLTGAGHLARHSPARVLREVEAKRRLIDALEREADRNEANDNVNDYHGRYECGLLAGVQCLVTVYSDHPDYDPAWSR